MVYLIHFNKKFSHAQHYIGFVDHLKGHTFESRLEYHKKGADSKLMRAVTQAGISVRVADIWPDGDRNFERMLKNKKKARCFCPICINEKKANNSRKKVREGAGSRLSACGALG